MSELMPYTESKRDMVEARLAAERNKREIMYRRNHGITVIAYYLVAEQVCTIWVHDERVDDSAEFIVPNAEVADWHEHPFAHPDANIKAYNQSQNGLAG